MELISEATTIEKALEMRTRQYNYHIPTTTYGEVEVLQSDNLRETIRAIVREELWKLLPFSQPQVDPTADIVR